MENCRRTIATSSNMPFEDVHRLVMTMRMAELILNDRAQVNRRDKMAEIKAQLDADCGHNTAALLAELHRAKSALTQKHSIRSVGAFEADAYNLEGLIIFETMMLTRAIDWVARLSIDPRAEIRRGTVAVPSELQSAYTSQRTLHELYFYQHDDKLFGRESSWPCPTWESGSQEWPSIPQAV
jgi:hypothetical protein